MNHSILKLITVVHILFILFIVLAPFSTSNYILTLHAIITPFLMMHWILNDNTCALTILEKYIRTCIDGEECNNDKSFMANLINPIYDFKTNNEDFSVMIYLITIALWLISVSKLIHRYNDGTIKTALDLLKI